MKNKTQIFEHYLGDAYLLYTFLNVELIKIKTIQETIHST